MDKRGIEELGPSKKLEWIMWTIISIAVLIMLITIFTQFVAK